jgi:hypothetical protein
MSIDTDDLEKMADEIDIDATLKAASTKAKWQFRQEGLPSPSEAEAAEPWEPWKKNGAGTAWRRTLQQAVYEEARRCLNVIAHEDPDMTVEDMPKAVQHVAGHLILLDRGYRWGVLCPPARRVRGDSACLLAAANVLVVRWRVQLYALGCSHDQASH